MVLLRRATLAALRLFARAERRCFSLVMATVVARPVPAQAWLGLPVLRLVMGGLLARRASDRETELLRLLRLSPLWSPPLAEAVA